MAGGDSVSIIEKLLYGGIIGVYLMFLLVVYSLFIFTIPGLLMLAKRLRRLPFFILAAILSAAVFFGGTGFLANHPRVIIPPEHAPYIEEWMVDEMRETFHIIDPFLLSIPLTIRVVSASETHFAAEASYSGFGGRLGMARNFRSGKWYSELYEP